MSSFTFFLGILTWLAGIALAKGFWATLAALVVPFFGWYLVVEQILVKLNFLV